VRRELEARACVSGGPLKRTGSMVGGDRNDNAVI